MVVVVDAGLAGVEVWWWDPFGAAVLTFSCGPAALFDEAVVGSAGQGELVGIRLTVLFGPAVDVVDLAPVARCGAAGSGAAAVQRVQHDALPGGGEAFSPPAVELFGGVLVVDHQVVMRLAGQSDDIGHRQQAAAGGDTTSGGGFEVLQRGGDDDRGRQAVEI